MAGGYLYGWDSDYDRWIKVLVDSTGKLRTSMAGYFENVPTDGEMNKGPTSNWAYDHNADASAHHVKYTDAEAIAAAAVYEENPTNGESGKAPTSNWAYDHNADASAHHVKYTDEEAIAAAAVYEDTPLDGVLTKAPTSNWAYDHKADASAHHAKYTNLEAQTACNLNGDLYLTIPGIGFSAYRANVDNYLKHPTGVGEAWNDDVNIVCGVILPDGATVTAVKVDGDAGAASQTWTLNRVAMSNQALSAMASATVQTEDTTINNAVIDNSLYCYVINIPLLTTNDEIYYARVKYTL